MNARVLVVEDDSDWIATYRMWLEEDGHEVRGVSTAAEARAEVSAWRPHVVLVDQRLEGPGGRDVGLSVLRQLSDLFPPAQLFIVTGYGTREAVERAFREGAVDYVEKNTVIMEPLLRIKVRAAVQVASRAIDGEGAAIREARLRESWAGARVDKNQQQKGRLLEQAMRDLFESVPGFTHARTNVQNETEEIDLFLANRSMDPTLAQQGTFIVVECKNWSTSVGTEVVSRLREKVAKRYKQARLGVCVSMGGFTAPTRTDVLTERRGEILLLLLDAADIDAWIAAEDRADWLVRRIQQAVVAG